MRICPKDLKPCPDDLCRGSGRCIRTGDDMLDTCDRCGQIYSEEFNIDCACEPEYPDYRDEEEYGEHQASEKKD